MARDIEDVIASIEEMFERVEQGNYYDILGLAPDAPSSAVTPLYRELAKTWHVDRYSMYDLGEHKVMLQKIFAEVNNANRTLSDEGRRAEYDASLNGEDGDLASAEEVAALINADTFFLRGKNFLKQGSYKGASEQFTEAAKLNPQDDDIKAYSLYSEYLLIPKNAEGRAAATQRANEIYTELSDMLAARGGDIDWLMVFIATVGLGIGKERQSKSIFREVLMISPNNFDAQRQLRLLEMRKDRDSKEGLLDKLKGFFAKK